MKRFAAVMVLSCLGAVSGWGAPARAFMQNPKPGDTPDRRPVFEWTAATDATKYLLKITRNGSPYLDKWTRKTSWAPRFDLPEGVYEAKVIGYDGAQYGQWSRSVKMRRVYSPALASVNGLLRDGGNVVLEAGEGIEIDTVQSNLTVIIRSTGITATQIINMAITTEKIDDRAVTYEKLADGAVSGTKLADGSVTSNKLGQAAVTTEALADGSVTEAKLASGAVTSGKIGTGAVGNAKLADASVTSNKIAAASVRMTHLHSANALSGQFLKWNGSSWGPAYVLNGYAEGAINTGPTASGVGSIALGDDNQTSAAKSIAAGGWLNIIRNNSTCSVILGGEDNVVSSNAPHSIILGGKRNNITKQYSVSAGFQASATNEGSFVWADSTGTGASSWGPNTMMFLANGGVRFQSSTPAAEHHRVEWKPGDAEWQFSSDRNLKDNIRPVDARAILEKVEALTVANWRFKGYEREHIGVMAQDFHREFALKGADPTLLDGADLHGVSLAAIQALALELKSERARNEALEARIKALEDRFAASGEDPPPQ